MLDNKNTSTKVGKYVHLMSQKKKEILTSPVTYSVNHCLIHSFIH